MYYSISYSRAKTHQKYSFLKQISADLHNFRSFQRLQYIHFITSFKDAPVENDCWHLVFVKQETAIC